jgi:hypothetical protein
LIRGLGVGTLIAGSFLGRGPRVWTDPDACKLLSVAEASALSGSTLVMTHTESNSTFSTCAYRVPSQGPLANHVEIHYWVLADATAAQARFQRVVHPGPMAGTTVTAVQKLGDEADTTCGS